ncbi:hypothetical protein KQI84_16440 [bacterium]|nr:hypothetical protein [bacterium]
MKATKPLIVATAILIAVAIASANSTIDTTDRYSWGANVGWIDWRAGDGTDGAVITSHYASGYIYSANIGWINLGDGSPTNGHSYSNAAADDFGVNVSVDPSSSPHVAYLNGFAWSANAGWLAFYSASPANRPRVNLVTGELEGYAWGANIGWLPLSQASAVISTDMSEFPTKTEVSMMVMANTPYRFAADYNADGVVDAADVIVAPL